MTPSMWRLCMDSYGYENRPQGFAIKTMFPFNVWTIHRVGSDLMVVISVFIDISKISLPMTTIGSPALWKVLRNFFSWRKLDTYISIHFPSTKPYVLNLPLYRKLISIVNIMSISNSVVKLISQRQCKIFLCTAIPMKK